jgi:hypothetical protein
MAVTDSGTLHHTCFVVHDLEKAAQALADSLGVVWNVWTIEPETSTVHGRDVPFSFKVALAQVGGAALELIQPHTGRSVYVEHLESEGEGFHHTCIAFGTHEELQQAKAELETQGREMIQHGGLGELGEFCYFDMPETGGALELLFLSGALPPPEQTIG